ncbi:hypothetical protein ACFQ09_04990 [Massilia norwichensis]|uniref:Uncharacterized protein n=1 Tax=Massilia norwichensis TaxID=1442366 RepID=A0ABT2ADX6_9BURK|nr:hypothetical protein [Massilia norwichensis]MCS0592401.1 hypothetical protein [Massilia norwichensis]
MPNLISAFESVLELQLLILGCGLATFCPVVLYGGNPLCTWFEWTDRCGRGAEPAAPDE